MCSGGHELLNRSSNAFWVVCIIYHEVGARDSNHIILQTAVLASVVPVPQATAVRVTLWPHAL